MKRDRSITTDNRRPEKNRVFRVGIVGAGLSGLVAARILRDRGYEVDLYEKSRGPGGRMSTRREGERRFDHGAQYFTVRDDRFRSRLEAWFPEGMVRPWALRPAVVNNGHVTFKDDATERFVGVPGMNALAAHLAESLSPRFNTRVITISGRPGSWRLHDHQDREFGPHDALLLSAPPAQAADLVSKVAPDLAEKARSVVLDPCWAVMAVFSSPLDRSFDAAFVESSPLSWISRNTSKPERPADEAWVLHGSPAWSTKHLEDDPDQVARDLHRAFFKALGRPLESPVLLKAHRWRYAIAREPLESGSLFCEEKRIVLCGDWCAGSRVEGAFLSGLSAADRLTDFIESP